MAFHSRQIGKHRVHVTFDTRTQVPQGTCITSHEGGRQRCTLPEIVMVRLGHGGAEAPLQVRLERGQLLPLALEAPVVREVQMYLQQADERHGPDYRTSARPYDARMRIVRLGAGDERLVLTGAELFDHAPTEAWTARFLSNEGHHLLVAVDDGPVGFISGVETTHPDKGTEMFLYELSVRADHRRRGVGTALVRALADLARERGCYGMWVGAEPENAAALATYRAAGAAPPEPCVTLSWTFE
jgi:GNAT superfamily N-acetyltransferase